MFLHPYFFVSPGTEKKEFPPDLGVGGSRSDPPPVLQKKPDASPPPAGPSLRPKVRTLTYFPTAPLLPHHRHCQSPITVHLGIHFIPAPPSFGPAASSKPGFTPDLPFFCMRPNPTIFTIKQLVQLLVPMQILTQSYSHPILIVSSNTRSARLQP